MNENALFFQVYFVILDTKIRPVGHEKLVGIFKTLEDAAEFADMKNSKAPEDCEYNVYGRSYPLDELIMKGDQADGKGWN